MRPLVGDFEFGARAFRHGDQIGLSVLVEEELHLVAHLGREALHVIELLRAVVVADAVNAVGLIAAHAHGLVGEMLPEVVTRDIVLVLRRPDDDPVVALELAQQLAAAVGVQAADILVEPDVLAAERRGAALLEDDLMDAVAREEVALALAPLDGEGREIEVDDHLFQARTGLEVNLQHLGLTVRIDRHIEYLALGRTLGDVVLLVTRDGLDGAALHHDRAVLAVAVQHVVDRALVVALEDPDVVDALLEEGLVAHLGDDVAAVLREDDHVVDVRAVAYEFGVLHRLADAEEALGAVDVELGIGHGDLRGLDVVELTQLGAALLALAVLVADTLVVGHGVLGEMVEVVLRGLDVLLDLTDLVVGLVAVVTRDADELQFRQALHVGERDLAAQPFLERLQPLVHGGVGLFAALAALDELVELVLDENAFERRGMPGFVQFAEPDLQLAPQQPLGMLGRAAQDLAHTQEMGFLLPDDAGVGGDRNLAVGEGVEGVDGFVARLVGRNLDDDLDLVGRIVIDLPDFDLALVVGLDDRILDRLGGRGIGDFGDGERAFVDLRNLGTHLHGSAPQAVVIAAHVGHAARREVGVKLEFAPFEVCDAGIDELHEVVGQDLRRQTHGDAVGALRQQQRELDRQRDGFLLAAVVGQHPLGGFLVEDHFGGELRQARLDVTPRGGLVAREDIAPVTLAVDQQVFLPQLHQCVLDRRIAVRVVLHGLSHDVGHLVVASVVDDLHGVQDAPLHGFEAVLDMGYGAFEDHVRSVVQEPVLIHARQFAHAPFVLRQAVELARPGRGVGGRGRVGRIAGGLRGRGLFVERLVPPDGIFFFCHIA